MTNSFRINDRVYGGSFACPQREFRVREVSASGALRLQEVGGPRLPLWISQNTAVAWAEVEAHADNEALRDEHRWTFGAIIDMEAEAYAEDARRSGLVDAGHLGLVGEVDDRTGASVRMWAGVQCAPIEWGAVLATGTAWVRPPANPYSADYRHPLTDFERRCGVAPL